MAIQWFPGHMTKTVRRMEEDVKLVDAVCELCDARIPASSRSPVLGEIIKNKPRFLIMTKSDLADKTATDEWLRRYRAEGIPAFAADTRDGNITKQFAGKTREALGTHN